MPSAVGGRERPSASQRITRCLDVDPGVVSAPAVRVHGRSHVVRQRSHRIGRGIDEAEEAGMRVAERPREDLLADEGDQLVGGHAGLGERLVEEGGGLADLAEHRARAEAFAVGGHRLHGQATQPPQLVGRKVECVHGMSRIGTIAGRDCRMRSWPARAGLSARSHLWLRGARGQGRCRERPLTFGVAEPRDFWMHVAGCRGAMWW